MLRRLKTLFELIGAKVVDEKWYLSQYPDVRVAVRDGLFKSALSHYLSSGYAEKRLPSKPVVDEAWYLKTYPDVAAAIREGRETSAYDHFVKSGYHEGRTATTPDNTPREPVGVYVDFCSRRSSWMKRGA